MFRHWKRQCNEAADVAFSKRRFGSVKNETLDDSKARQRVVSACSVLCNCAFAHPIASRTAKCSLGGSGVLFAEIVCKNVYTISIQYYV